MGVIDYLTCGGCQTEFPLSNIVKFMQHKKNAACALPDERNGPSNSGNESSNYSCYTCPEKFEAAVSLLQHAQYRHKQNIFRDSMNNQTRADNNTSRTNHFLPTNSDSKVPHMEDCNTREEEDVDLNKSAENVQTSSNSTVDNDVDQESEMMEPLDKCCTSVIPKKRKRHIETKHRSSFFKNARPKRPVPPPKMAPSDINIYLDPADLHAASLSREAGDNTQNSGSEGDSQGLLLEPGGLVTIPFSNSRGDNNYFGISYSGAPTPTDSNSITPDETRPPSPFNNNNVRKPHTHEATQQSPSITNENIPDTSASSRKKYPTSKPFKCDHCGDSFNQRIHLKKHLSKHTGVKPYKCGQCDYATVERSHLKVHIRIHTGEKPFKCTHCEYATAQNSTLKIHLKRHHGGTLTLCAHCGTRCEKFLPEKKQLLPNKQEQPVTSLSPCILPSHSPPISAAPHPSSGTTSHTTISHSLPRSTLLSKTSGENMRSEDVP